MRICDITGKKVRKGNRVSHANNKSKRTFSPNLHEKKFFLPEQGVWVKLKVSSTALRTINKNGISVVLKEAIEKGHLSF